LIEEPAIGNDSDLTGEVESEFHSNDEQLSNMNHFKKGRSERKEKN